VSRKTSILNGEALTADKSIAALRQAGLRLLALALRPSWVMLSVAAAILSIYLIVVGCGQYSYPLLNALISVYPGEARLPENFYIFNRLSRWLSAPRDPAMTTVVVVGGSTSRESIWDEAYLGEKIEAASGRRVEVVDLTVGGSLPTESWTAAEVALCNGADYVLFGLNVGVLRKVDRIFNRVGYSNSDALAAMKAAGLLSRDTPSEVPGYSSRFVAAGLEMLRQRLVFDLLDYRSPELGHLPKRRNARHRQMQRPVPTPEQLQRELRTATNLHVTDGAQPERFATFLQTMLGALQRCGGKVVFFDAPMNPSLGDPVSWPAYAALYRDYKTAMAQTAENAGTPFISINDMVDYTLEDFADFGHLRTERAIKATSDRLALELSRMMAGGAGAKP
jgi:hypothetical protein